MYRFPRFVLLIVCAFLLLGPLTAHGADDTETPATKLPWTLRPHFVFSLDHGVFDYGEDNAEWRVRLVDEIPQAEQTGIWKPTVTVDAVGFLLRLGEDREIANTDFGKPETEREPFDEGPFGAGSHYTVVFPPKDGLVVRHRVTTYKTQAFVLISISVENRSEAPVSLREIVPAVIGPGGISGWSDQTRVCNWRMDVRAGSLVFDKDRVPLMTLLHDPAAEHCVALGMLPRGRGANGIDLQSSNGAWQGEAVCRFDPPISLAPGETMACDPLWVSYGLAVPSEVQLYYAWSLSQLPRRQEQIEVPRAWMTVPDDGGLDDLVRLAGAAKRAGVKHALVPGNWEGKPGSMQGGTPRFPKSMQAAAGALRSAGFIPGITLEALAVGKGSGPWLAESPDGQRWADATQAAGKAHVAGRVKTALGWGFAFVVIAPSRIPDSALSQFGHTRARADEAALAAAWAAAPDSIPVFPASATALRAERDAWLEAAGALSRSCVYGMTPAPVRLSSQELEAFGEEVAAAMRLWPGPIEIVGAPATAACRSLRALFARGRVTAHAMDGASQAPCLWQATAVNAYVDKPGGAVLAFAGAPAWTLADLEIEADARPLLWRAATGEFVDAEHRAVPEAASLEIHGINTLATHPALMGVSGDLMLHLDLLKAIAWDAASGELRGQFRGLLAEDGMAHVFFPEAWEYKLGRANGKPAKGEVLGRRLSFALAGPEATFALKFVRP